MEDRRDGRGPGTRSKARKRALDILFEADLRQRDPLETLADHVARDEPPIRPFTAELVEGFERHRGFVDSVLADCLISGWTVDRMPRVDRNLARIAIYELWFGDVEGEIAVDEAVSLASALSTDDSPKFLNGLLGRALERRRAEAAEPERAEAESSEEGDDEPTEG